MNAGLATSAARFPFCGTTFARITRFGFRFRIVVVFSHKFSVNFFEQFFIVYRQKSFVLFVARKAEYDQFVGIYTILGFGRLKKDVPFAFIIDSSYMVKLFYASVLSR